MDFEIVTLAFEGRDSEDSIRIFQKQENFLYRM